MKKKLTLGFSPCPNDCFIFDALVHGKIDTEGLDFDVVVTDVESLNKQAISSSERPEGALDITKLSYAAYAVAAHDYVLLDSGSALGYGVGPLLISKFYIPQHSVLPACLQFSHLNIAIPGQHTSANFLFSLAFPDAKNKIEMLFSEIENAILSGKADAGVIIHENRFTYEQKGLKKIIDLGEWWEKQTGYAIPLGGIAIKRDLPDELKKIVNRLIRRSVEFAFSNPESSMDFVKKNAQEMNVDIMYKHIGLYVNKFSVDLGEEGKRAVMTFLGKTSAAGIMDTIPQDMPTPIFCSDIQ